MRGGDALHRESNDNHEGERRFSILSVLIGDSDMAWKHRDLLI